MHHTEIKVGDRVKISDRLNKILGPELFNDMTYGTVLKVWHPEPGDEVNGHKTIYSPPSDYVVDVQGPDRIESFHTDWIEAMPEYTTTD